MTIAVALAGRRGSGKATLIDEADAPIAEARPWYLHSCGYAVSHDGTYLHRALAKPPAGLQVDHVNGDRLDNRRCNLRVTTATGNSRNSGASRRSTSGFKGVSKTRGGRWRAYINIQRRQRTLGVHATAELAARAYDAAAVRLYGEYARLNFGAAGR